MLSILSIPLSFFIFLILVKAIAGPLNGVYSTGNETMAVYIALAMLFLFSLIAGFLGGFLTRERIGPLFAGIVSAIYIMTANDGTLIGKAIFFAPYANIGTDNVLMGLAIVLFTFLWGGKLGEQTGFRKDRSRLLPDGV